jgi:hypothetical protein
MGFSEVVYTLTPRNQVTIAPPSEEIIVNIDVVDTQPKVLVWVNRLWVWSCRCEGYGWDFE